MVANSYYGPVIHDPRFPVSPGRFPAEPPGPWHTPDIPPLWGAIPDPPVIRTTSPVDVWFGYPRDPLPQRPPIGDPMMQRPPNSRHPVTGAPTWRPEFGDDPLPPSWNVQSAANGAHPITGAPTFVADRPPTGWWQPDQRPAWQERFSGDAPAPLGHRRRAVVPA
jgi:hypothetical protein